MASDGGLKSFQKRMRAIPKAARLAVRPALEKSADELTDAVRDLVPVGEGDLWASVDWENGPPPPESTIAKEQSFPDPDLVVTVKAGNDDVFYAPFVEFGTMGSVKGARVSSTGKRQSGAGRLSYRTHPGTVAQPFFWPAYRLMKPRIQRRIKRAIAKAIKEARG